MKNLLLFSILLFASMGFSFPWEYEKFCKDLRGSREFDIGLDSSRLRQYNRMIRFAVDSNGKAQVRYQLDDRISMTNLCAQSRFHSGMVYQKPFRREDVMRIKEYCPSCTTYVYDSAVSVAIAPRIAMQNLSDSMKSAYRAYFWLRQRRSGRLDAELNRNLLALERVDPPLCTYLFYPRSGTALVQSLQLQYGAMVMKLENHGPIQPGIRRFGEFYLRHGKDCSLKETLREYVPLKNIRSRVKDPLGCCPD